MLPRRILAALLLFVPSVLFGQQAPYRLIGYVQPDADLKAIGAKKLTHINFAFAQVSQSGEVMFEDRRNEKRILELRSLKKRNPALKIILSVGGWGADNFSDAALTDASRKKFADSVGAAVQKYSLDGIDLDWEYPGQPGPGIKYRVEDKQNFTLLLKAVRERLDALSDARGRRGADRYTLSIATAGGRYFAQTEMDKLHPYVDWMNLMTYDFYTGSTNTTGHHTPLLRSPYATYTVSSTDSMVTQHLAAGIPRQKLVIGAAFYGRGWSGVNPERNGLFQPFEKYTGEFPYQQLAREYIDRQGFKRFWDDSARAPYLWNAKSRTLISYDDPQSLQAKAAWLKQQHLGGIMYWQHGQDPGETLLDVLSKNLLR